MSYQEKLAKYESYKRVLSAQGISAKEYEKKLVQMANRLKL